MSSRKDSEGGISPTGIATPMGKRSSANTPVMPGTPSWEGTPRIPGIGFSNGNPFERKNSNNGLRAAATSFQPSNGDSQGRLRFLSLNSTRDDLPTIVTSFPALKHAVQEPIGTKSSSASSSPVHAKAWFTTDLDPNKPPMGGHFLLIQGLKEHDLATGVMSLIDQTYSDDIRGKKLMKAAEDGEHTDVVLYVNDIRTSTKIYNDLESEGLLSTSYVGHDWYGGKGVRIGSVDPKTMYVAQVTFIAEFKGRTADFNPAINVYDHVREAAENFGVVLAFEQNKSAQYPLWQFRVEYYKVSAAERSLSSAGDGIKLENIAGWMIFAKQYVPPTFSPVLTAKKPLRLDINAVKAPVVPPEDAEIVMSATGRTAWYTDADGVCHPVPPPRLLTNVSREMSDNGSWKGKELVPYRGFENMPPPSAQRPLAGYLNQYPMDVVMREPFFDNDLAYYNSKDCPQDIIPARIYNGLDVRTTVMLRNIPNHWTWPMLKNMLDQVCFQRYNFMYLRIDFKENKNVGYAFINFENAPDICDFVNAYVGKPWEVGHMHFGKPKLVQCSYATIQGLEQLIEKFRNSSVMEELVDYRPKLYQTVSQKAKDEADFKMSIERGIVPDWSIVEIGEHKDFPKPNNLAKKERSTANAGQIGLYAPRFNRSGLDRWHRSQYDRGTPHQLMENQVMIPPQVASFTYGTPRFGAVYPPHMGMPFHHGNMSRNMAGPQFMFPPSSGFVPGTPFNGRMANNNGVSRDHTSM